MRRLGSISPSNTVSRAGTLGVYYITTRRKGKKALELATAVIDLVGKIFTG